MEQRISYQELDAGFLRGINQSEVFVSSSGIDPKLLELLRFRVSQINSCAYCLDMHSKEALAMGETELRLLSVSAWRECPYYDDRERAALEFAETLTHANKEEVSDRLFAELTLYFSKEEIAALTLAIANINTWNRINMTFQVRPGEYVVGQYA